MLSKFVTRKYSKFPFLYRAKNTDVIYYIFFMSSERVYCAVADIGGLTISPNCFKWKQFLSLKANDEIRSIKLLGHQNYISIGAFKFSALSSNIRVKQLLITNIGADFMLVVCVFLKKISSALHDPIQFS